MICQYCGCPLEDGLGVCPNCGSPVGGGNDAPAYQELSLEAQSGEAFAEAGAEPVSESVPEPPAQPKPDPKPEPKPAPKPAPKPEPKPAPKPAPAPKPVYTPPATTPPAPKKKKKRGCCGCGCFLPLLLVLALGVFLIFSGTASDIMWDMGYGPEFDALIDELFQQLPFDRPDDAGPAVQVPEGNIPADAVEWNGHYYYLFTEPVDSYEEAVAFCQAQGGYMATATSDRESRFLYNYLLDSGISEYVYLGATDRAEEGVWVWSNGEPFDYTNWNSGEPNNDVDGEHEMAMHRLLEDGMWNDIAFMPPVSVPIYPEVSAAEASSSLSGQEYYGPECLIDGDLSTAWNEGADGIDGESVTYYFNGDVCLTALEIRGGFQDSEERYYSNARPAWIELRFPNGDFMHFELADTMDAQVIPLNWPVITDQVTLTVLSAYPGSYYQDLCITELYYHSGYVPVTGFLCEWGEIAE